MDKPPQRLLMGPGPSSVEPRVLAAISQPTLGHLDPAFLAIMDSIAAMLRQVFRTSNPLTLTISGTGTAGMEAAIANIVEPADRVLVCVAGYFGARMAQMVRRCGGEPILVEVPWGRPVPPDDIERALAQAAGPIKAVTMVHAETSTGVMQPLDDAIRLAHARGALVIVDAVTSLGGIPLDVDGAGGGEGIDVCYSGSQKCLGAPPGLAPITVGPRAHALLKRRKNPPVSFALDLLLLSAYWGAERTYHHTAPSNSYYGLAEALEILLEEGLENRWARHRTVHERLALGTAGLGLDFLSPPEHRLPVLNALRVPAGVDEKSVRARLLAEHNIEIGGGLGPLAGQIWRVGLMGGSAREENVARLLTALRIILGAGRMSRPSRGTGAV
jgi:alanine-glyoxylate transaminase/serine-glyoxylate transaminase/serine-pyruvate transaminase